MSEGRVIITDKHDLPLEADGITVVLNKPLLVATGEYADQGEPDILVHVVHAVDFDGGDYRMVVAQHIAHALQPLADRAADLNERLASQR